MQASETVFKGMQDFAEGPIGEGPPVEDRAIYFRGEHRHLLEDILHIQSPCGLTSSLEHGVEQHTLLSLIVSLHGFLRHCVALQV